MTAKKFTAQVESFARKSKARSLGIFRASSAKVMEIANVPKAKGGRLPVDTGALRNSTVASTAGLPDSGSGPPELVFASMQIGDTVWAGWHMAYARRMEYGFQGADSMGRVYNQQGNGFLRAAVQLWPKIVDDVTEEAKRRFP